MDTITIICYVAAEFMMKGGKGRSETVYKITPNDIGLIKQAPAWIKDTIMFKWLSKDGSIKYVTDANKKQAENEPMTGIAADGKEFQPEDAGKPTDGAEAKTEVSEAAPKKRTRKKKDDAE